MLMSDACSLYVVNNQRNVAFVSGQRNATFILLCNLRSKLVFYFYFWSWLFQNFLIYRKKQTKLTSYVLFSKPICKTHVQICYGLILHILWNVSIFFLSIYVPWKKETKHVMIPWYVPFAFRDTSKNLFYLTYKCINILFTYLVGLNLI